MTEKETEKELVRLAFAMTLYKRRIQKKMAQDDVAEAGLARSHVSDLESGRCEPKLSTLFALARILGMRPAMFVAAVERAVDRMALAETPRLLKPPKPRPEKKFFRPPERKTG